MTAKRSAALAAILLAASVGHAEVIGRIELIETGLDDLLGGGLFDVYHVVISNPVGDGTSAAFTFPGMFFTGTGTTFRSSIDFAAPNLADSFIVVPPGNMLGGLQTDTAFLIDVAYTVSGNTPVVPLGVTTVAVLSVPAGFVPDVDLFSGDLIIDGEAVPVNFVPEPAGLALAAMSLAGIAARRGTQPHRARR